MSALPMEAEGAATGDGRTLRAPWDRRRVVMTIAAAMFLTASVYSLRSIGFSVRELIRGFRDSGYLSRALPPSFEGWQSSLRQLGRTFSMAVAGTALAGVLSVPFGFLAARNTSPTPTVRTLFRALIVATRAIPDLVFAVFFVVALSIGELPGVLALGVHSIGMLGKLLADAIEEIDEGPREAALASGATRLQSISSAVVPQVVPQFLSAVMYRLDINTRVSVVLGFVGAGGIGMELRQNLRNPLRYPIGVGQALMVMVLVLVVDRCAAGLRRALDGYSSVRTEQRDRQTAVSIATPDRLRRPSLLMPMNAGRAVLMAVTALGLAGTVYSSLLVGLQPVSLVNAFVKSAAAVRMFVPPDFTTYGSEISSAFGQTFAIGLAATFLGLCTGIPFALLVARNTTPNRAIGIGARTVQVIVRSIPELVVVLLFISAVGLGPLPGAVALSIGAFGLSSKLLADAIETLPDSTTEGVRAAGATRRQEVASAVTPQLVPSLVSTGLYSFDVSIRSSSVLGIVGAGGIGRVLDESNAMLEYETVAAVIILLFVAVFALEQFSVAVRKALL